MCYEAYVLSGDMTGEPKLLVQTSSYNYTGSYSMCKMKTLRLRAHGHRIWIAEMEVMGRLI